MTKKDFVFIAKVLKDSKPNPEEYEALKRWNIVVENMRYEFSTTNPRFKSMTFLQACSYGSYAK